MRHASLRHASLRHASLRQLTDLFVNNGYPKKFVKTTIRNTLNNKSTREDEIKYTYLKLPFINEEFKRRALAVVKRSGIDNVRIQFMNGKSSRRVFAPPRDLKCCREDLVVTVNYNPSLENNEVFC